MTRLGDPLAHHRAVSFELLPPASDAGRSSLGRTIDESEALQRDFALTQFFFDIEHYLRLRDELAALGVEKPIIPGVMPIVDGPALRRILNMNGTNIPGWLEERPARAELADGPERIRRLGTDIAIELCHELIEAGAPGLHVHTLNCAATAEEICSVVQAELI